MVPNPGQFNGNPRGVYNTNFMGQGNAPSSIQQTNLGRYVPPTMTGGNGQWNTNQWNNSGGYNYNLPGSYGSPQGGGQFAPMPGQFGQYMFPNQLSGNTFGFGNLSGQGMQQYPDLYAMRMGGGNGAPSYDEWRGGFMTDMMVRSPEETAAREADFRRMYEEEFGNQGGQQQGRGPMPPGKDGRPLRDPNQAGSVGMDPLSFLSQESMRNNGRGNFQGYGPAPMPAYDRPESRAYNMQALREMMGGF